MSVFQKLLPKILEEVNSPINGKIQVIEWFGKRKIVVNKLTQSGPIMEEIWGVAFKEIKKQYSWCHSRESGNPGRSRKTWIPDQVGDDKGKRKVLVLGLGGGSIIKILQKYLPNSQITAVDLDPLMIQIGKKYLGFKREKNLKIIIGDAVKFVADYAGFPIRSGMTRGNFDLIFVDLFRGDKIPKFLENKKILTDLKFILSENGLIVFNRHYYQNHIFEAKIFLDKIKEIFNDVKKKKILTNLLIFCRKRGEV